jgi:protease IV
MKYIFFLIIFFPLVLSLHSQVLSDDPVSGVAVRDDVLSPLINPAALGFGNAAGAAYLQAFDDSGILPDSTIILNGQYGSTVFDITEDGYTYSPAIGFPVVKNLYAGLSVSLPNFTFDDVNGSIGLLFRPLDSISLGAVARYGPGEEYNITGGIGLRPFFFSKLLSDRLTLSADIGYANGHLLGPVFGVDIEPLGGLRLNLAYNFREERLSGGLSFSYDHIGAGGFINLDSDYQPTSGYASASFSVKSYRTIQFSGAKRVIDYAINPVIEETYSFTSFGPMSFDSGASTIQDVIAEIKSFKEDPSVGALFFRNRFIYASYANFLELKEALLDFKSAGKKIYFYFEDSSNLNYALAAATADRIFLNPHGSVYLTGFAGGGLYFKNLLDLIGVDVENFRSHEFKTALNSYSEEAMTEAEREALEYMLDGWMQSFSSMIEDGRGDRLSGPAAELIDRGPYLIANNALEAGLVDHLVYEDEIEQIIQEDDPDFMIPEYVERSPMYSLVDFEEFNTRRYDWSDSYLPMVAVIHAVGGIHTGDGVPGQTIGSTTTAEAIRWARQDPDIEGIILRVDSGGGSALASDIIAREIELCKTGETPKPVIVSMGGMAASGGYYISAQADAIVAQPVTLTGSIGVVGMTLNIEELLKKIGIHWDVVKAGEHSDFATMFRRMSEDEKTILANSISDIYDYFIKVVSSGREMTEEDVHAIAQGRVWTGAQALDRGLVDALGGWNTTIGMMKDKLGTAGEIELIDYSPGFPMFDFGSGLALSVQKPSLSDMLPGELQEIGDMIDLLYLLGDEYCFYLMPYTFTGVE